MDILAARTFSDLNEVAAKIENGVVRTALGAFPANGLTPESGAIVCIRQGGVRLLPADEGVPARVLDVRFLGDVALVELAVAGLETPFLARVREGATPAQGAEVGVGIEAAAVLVFPAEDRSADAA
jgi:iron(III) transport system ATP-binding protein